MIYHISTRGGQLSKCPEMWLFLCKSCLNDITRWFMRFGAKRTTPVVWTEIQFKFWHWVSTLQATTPQPGPLFIPKQDRGTSFMIPNYPGVWKVYLVKVGFPFLAPLLLIFSKGNGLKWGAWPSTAPFCPIFVAMIFFHWNVDRSYKNDTNKVSGWWDMREWWWKIGFMSRKTRRVCPSWQHSSSGAASRCYL